MLAASNGHVDVVGVLMHANAELEAKTNVSTAVLAGFFTLLLFVS